MQYWWKDRPWRMVQTNLRETDMSDIDASVYVEKLRKLGATVVMINAAGIIASYPTALSFHTQSDYLTGDSLQTIITACHEADIRVIARTDFSKVRRALYEQHPEWACIYDGGVIEDYNGDVHCCINGDYQRVYAPQIIKEAITTLDFDGIFFNMGGYVTHNYSHRYLGICRCANCVTAFRDFAGTELPPAEDMADPSYRRYLVFKKRTVSEHRERIIATIRAVRPEIAVDADHATGLGFFRQESNTEIGRPLPHWQYSASENTKRAVTSRPDLVSSNTSVDFLGFFHRHVSVQPAQQKLRLWQNLANCGGLDFYLIGRPDRHGDSSGFPMVQEVFAFHAAHFKTTYRSLRPVVDVLIVAGAGNMEEYRGWYRALVESHCLFASVSVDRLDSIDLSPYGAIVLPDARYLGNDTAAALDRFVAGGGTLIATGESAFFSDEYERRDACALECLGIRHIECVRHDMQSAMLDRRHDGKANAWSSGTRPGAAQDATRQHVPVQASGPYPGSAADIGMRDLVAIGECYVTADYRSEASLFHRLIPPHPYGPPERCYWTEVTNLPGIVKCPYGAGSGIYLPWLPGVLLYREGYDNTFGFMVETLRLAGVRRLGGNAPPMVEVTAAEARGGSTENFRLLQFVNGTGHFGNSYFAPVRLSDLALEIHLPFLAARIETLRSAHVADFSYEVATGVTTIHLARLDDFEAVKIFAAQ